MSEMAESKQAAQCGGKVPLDRATAQRAAARGRRKDRPVHAYLCRFCNEWHVGQRLSGGRR
jgi:uncharacterized protein YlaI